jgi:hypothetical protein
VPILRREYADVVANSHGHRLIHQTRIPPHSAVREHVIQQHGVDSSERQIAVRMHVVLVGHGTTP